MAEKRSWPSPIAATPTKAMHLQEQENESPSTAVHMNTAWTEEENLALLEVLAMYMPEKWPGIKQTSFWSFVANFVGSRGKARVTRSGMFVLLC